MDPETQALINACEQALIKKSDCTEMKALRNPPQEVLNVVVTLVDFVEGGTTAQNTFDSAKRKLFDYCKRGVGMRERVTPDQLECLRNFSQLGLTPDVVMSKSAAAASIAQYLHAVHVL